MKKRDTDCVVRIELFIVDPRQNSEIVLSKVKQYEQSKADAV
jgi:hypothetical protein